MILDPKSSAKSNKSLFNTYWKRMLVINSQISQYKNQSELIASAFIVIFFLQWIICTFQILQKDSEVLQLLTTFDNYLVINYTNNLVTFKGLVEHFHFITSQRLVRGINIVLFLVAMIYVASVTYIWFKEFGEVSYRLRSPYQIANIIHSTFVWLFLQPFLAVIYHSFIYDIEDLEKGVSAVNTILVLLHILITIINVIIYIMILLNTCLFYIEINVDSRDQLAGTFPDFKFIIASFRIVSITVQIFLKSSHYPQILYTIELIFSLIILIAATSSNISFNFKVTTRIIFFSSLIAVLNVNCLSGRSNLYQEYKIDPVLFTLFLVPILTKLMITIKRNREYNYSNYFKANIKSPIKVIHYLSNILYLISKREITGEQEYTELALLGHHKSSCTNSTCFCRAFIKMKSEKYAAPIKMKGIKAFNQFEARLISFVGSIYEHYLRIFPNHPLLNLSYSFFLMNFVGNILKSISYLVASKSKTRGLTQKYFFFKQMYEVSSYMDELNSDKNDLTNHLELPKAIEINENFEKLIKLFEEALTKNTHFFSELLSEKIDQSKIVQQIREMHRLNNQMTKVFQRISSKTTHHLGTLIVFGLFQKIVYNTIESNTTLSRAEELRSHLIHKNHIKHTFEDLEDILILDAGLLSVSGEKLKYGKIIYANKTLCNYFGYSTREMINENITCILPNMIGVNHEKYMREYENRGGGIFFKNIKALFGKHKEGYILPIHVVVKPVFNTKNGLEYIGLIKRVSGNSQFKSQYILTNNRGQIDSLTKELMDQLQLTSFILNSATIHIDQLLRNINEYYERILSKPILHHEHDYQPEKDIYHYEFDTELLVSGQLAQKSIEKIMKKQSPGERTKPQHSKKIKNASLRIKSKRESSPSIASEGLSLRVTNQKDYLDSRRSQPSKNNLATDLLDTKARKFKPDKQNPLLYRGLSSFSSEDFGSFGVRRDDPVENVEKRNLSEKSLQRPDSLILKKDIGQNKTLSKGKRSLTGRDVPLEDFEISCHCKIDRLSFVYSKEVYIVIELENIEFPPMLGCLRTKSRITTKSIQDIEISGSMETLENQGLYENLEAMRNSMLIIHSGSSTYSLENAQDIRARNLYINKFIQEFNLGKIHSLLYWMIWLVFLGLYFLFRANLRHTSNLLQSFLDELNIIGIYYPSRSFPLQVYSSIELIQGLKSNQLNDLITNYGFASPLYNNPYPYLNSFIADLSDTFRAEIEDLGFSSLLYKTSKISKTITADIKIEDEGTWISLPYLSSFDILFVKLESLQDTPITDNDLIIESLLSLSEANFLNVNSSFNKLIKASTNFFDFQLGKKPYILGVINPSILAELVLFLFVFLLLKNVIKKNKTTFRSILLLQPYCWSLYEYRLNSLSTFYAIQKELSEGNSENVKLLERKAHSLQQQKNSNRAFVSKKSLTRKSYRIPKVKLFRKEFGVGIVGSLVILILNIILNIIFVQRTSSFSDSFSSSLEVQTILAEDYFLTSSLIAQEISFLFHQDSTKKVVIESLYQNIQKIKGQVESSRQSLIDSDEFIKSIFQGSLCDSVIPIEIVELYDYCEKNYLGVAKQGFWLYEASVMQDINQLYTIIQQSSSVTLTADIQKKMIDVVYSSTYITKRVLKYVWNRLIIDVNGLLDDIKSQSTVFSIIDIVLITIFFIYNSIMIKKLSWSGSLIKKALRYFPDEVLAKDKNVLKYISATSQNKYGSLFKKKTALRN